MIFCPKCSSILIPKEGRNKKVKMVCSSCEYVSKEKEKLVLKEKSPLGEKGKLEVVDMNVETDPKTNIECPKCSHGVAYYYMVQTRAGDEPETTFLKCVKCSHKWRSY